MNKNNRFLGSLKNFKLCNKLPIWIIVPCVIVLVAFIVILSLSVINGSASYGFNIGIDFEGGTLLTVTLGEEAHSGNANYSKHVNKITKAIESQGVSVSYVQTTSGNITENDALQFRYRNISDDSEEIFSTNDKVVNAIKAAYPSLDASKIKTETIGKTAANDLIEKAAIALAVSIVLILIYIVFRFEFVSGIVAVITTLHDAIIMFLLTVMFRIQINSSYIAAAITIVSYSINNVIIIFDRCREIIKPMKGATKINYEEIGDSAVKATITRSVYTTFTTLITVVMLAIFGGVTMQEFVVPIIIGLFVGFYSSIFMATPIWAKLSYAFDGLRLKKLGKKLAEKENKELPKKSNVETEIIEGETIKKEKKPTKSFVWVNPKKTKFKKKK